MKLPWIKFYVADWLSDEALRSCSVEARGLWADMICLMAKSDRHGYLLIGGKPARSEQLARICGLTPQRTSELMDELHASGVFSFDQETIISRRMVKDEQVRKSDASRKMRMRHADVQKMSSECPTESPRQRLEARSQKLDNTRTQVRPLRAEWIAYSKEIGWSGSDVEGAFDYYESNGWKVGGRAAVKDWRACARNCQRRNQLQTKGTQPMKKSIKSGCDSPPTYKLMGFESREAWVKAGCP
ncbi:MAG: hypothetical protein EBS53_05450 [Bacteroidetes bacterium]|nr:hypothetical protein [Bacteroidota bacterium]